MFEKRREKKRLFCRPRARTQHPQQNDSNNWYLVRRLYGSIFKLPENREFTIGCSLDSDIIVGATFCSNTHCTIKVDENGKITLTDTVIYSLSLSLKCCNLLLFFESFCIFICSRKMERTSTMFVFSATVFGH